MIILQILVIATTILANVCGIATLGSLTKSKTLIESLVRCIVILAFTIFYYVSVSDSFSSDSLIFPLYLLFLSVAETRIWEVVERAMNLYVIPPAVLVGLLQLSSFIVALCIIGYALFPNISKTQSNLYTITALIASCVIAYYAPKSSDISGAWNSQIMMTLVTAFFAIAVIVAFVQSFIETSKTSRVKFIICILLGINNYINFVFNTIALNTIGTVLLVASIALTVVMVEINSTKL